MKSHLLLIAVASFHALTAQTHEKRIVPVDSSLRQSFERQPKVAVLAGIGHYPSRSGLSKLNYPAHDVDLLETELAKQGYRVVKLQESEATRGSVEQALRDAAELVDRGQGTLLFFFSGHGFAEKGMNYLAPFEATSANLAGSGLPLRRVEELLHATGAPRQVMFIDACRNEQGKAAGKRTFDSFRASEGLAELFSTKMGRISFESEQLGSGVFTHFLVKGLQGEAAGRDGLVTFRDLADYVTDGVSGFGFQRGQMQVPFEAGEHRGDFLLARVAVSSIAVTPKPGQERVNPKDGQTYVWIPPGSFRMGCSEGETECFANEEPAHDVAVPKGFWLGQTAVTVGAWKRYRNAAGVAALPASDSFGRKLNEAAGNDRLPAVAMTWDEANGYCEWSGGRLPSEAEWEYAGRAGTTGPRYRQQDTVAWYGDNSGRQGLDSAALWIANSKVYNRKLFDNGNGPKPVGLKLANDWNLYDMLGNVWQWTGDWHEDGKTRSLRGGAWDDPKGNIRVSSRLLAVPSGVFYTFGFRCSEE